MHVPKVSIGLPVYNGERYLRFAVDSILQQDYTDFELIISDNASMDKTPDICRDYAELDSRVRYHRYEVNQGASHNFRRVFELARGKYFKWAAYDDVCLPGFLRVCVETLDQAPRSVSLVVPRAETIDESGQLKAIGRSPECSNNRYSRPHMRLAKVLRTVSFAQGQYGLIRSEALQKTRLLDSFVESDYVLIAELALLGEIWEIPEVLLQLRHPETSICPHLNESAHLSWFDPSKKMRKSFLKPHTRIGLEYIRSIGRMQIRFVERLLCYLTFVIVWCPCEFGRLVQDLRNKAALRTRVKRSVRTWFGKDRLNMLES